MKGTLLKRRDVFKTYRPRLFVLDPPLLHYYLTPADVGELMCGDEGGDEGGYEGECL